MTHFLFFPGTIVGSQNQEMVDCREASVIASHSRGQYVCLLTLPSFLAVQNSFLTLTAFYRIQVFPSGTLLCVHGSTCISEVFQTLDQKEEPTLTITVPMPHWTPHTSGIRVECLTTYLSFFVFHCLQCLYYRSVKIFLRRRSKGRQRWFWVTGSHNTVAFPRSTSLSEHGAGTGSADRAGASTSPQSQCRPHSSFYIASSLDTLSISASFLRLF